MNGTYFHRLNSCPSVSVQTGQGLPWPRPPHVRTQQKGRLRGGGCPPPAGSITLETSSCPQSPGKTSPASSLPAFTSFSSSPVIHRGRAATSEPAVTSWCTRPLLVATASGYKRTTCSGSQSRTVSPGSGARPRACCAHSLLPLPSCVQRGPSGLTARPLAGSPGTSWGWFPSHLQTTGLSKIPGSLQL